jgi:hypothetical protein
LLECKESAALFHPCTNFYFGSHYLAMNDAGEDDEVGRVAPRSERKLKLTEIVSTARNAIWWVLKQVLKVLQIMKAAVQALLQTFLPEKFVARVESAIRSARERLVTAAVRSSLATWAVLSCTFNMLTQCP